MSQLVCPSCQATLEFAERKPSFCPYCGQALGSSTASKPVLLDTEAVTAPPRPRSGGSTIDPEAATLAPPAGMVAPADHDEPSAVGGYRLLRTLGGGGMGTVYEAEEESSGRRVALKLIARDYSGSSDSVERFRQEGRLASVLAHPRCVFVYAADEENGRPYIVMELMPGSTLQELVQENGSLPVTDAVKKMMDVLDGLKEAHELGILHRDVKPSNCFLEAEGRVKIGDFGLSKSLVGGAHLTRTGAFLGTPLYASPEQIRGDRLTAQSDVYSAAASLYFLLTGKAPFQSGDAAATLARIVSDDPPPIQTLRPEIPPALNAVVLRGLERRLDRRYRDMEEFRQALRPFLPGRSALVGLGFRFGAWFIDFLVVMVLGFLVVAPLMSLTPLAETGQHLYPGNTQVQLQFWSFLSSKLTWSLCFVPELIFGCSLGKWLLGLRVCNLLESDRPPVHRGLLRTVIFLTVPNIGTLLAMIFWMIYTVPPKVMQGDLEAAQGILPLLLAVSFLPLGGFVLGYGLLCSTMRERNGWRGLHEFLSGTRVIQLPAKEHRLVVRGPGVSEAATRSEGLSERVGPYAIKGSLWIGEKTQVLLGTDKSLGRDVVLWLRPAQAPALNSARRGINRTGRLRWLAAGHVGDQQWDAFLAPTGCALPSLIDSVGTLPWRHARGILESLTTELLVASQEHTLPRQLDVDQVWIQANGRPALLDFPLRTNESWPSRHTSFEPVPASGDAACEVVPLAVQEQQAGLTLLRLTANLMLRGQAEVAGDPLKGLPEPLPEHATKLLARIQPGERRCKDLGEFHELLLETKKLPLAVSRPRRAAHLAVLAACLFVGMGCCIVFTPMAPVAVTVSGLDIKMAHLDRDLRQLENVSRRDLLLNGINPAIGVRLTGLALYRADRAVADELHRRDEFEQSRYEARLRSLGGAFGVQLKLQSEQRREMFRRLQPAPEPFEASASTRARTWYSDPNELNDFYQKVVWAWIVPMLAIPLSWTLWAFVTRGGFSFTLAGLRLVRRDGCLAARWQCAWRALVLWLPLVALQVTALYLEGAYWGSWQVNHQEAWMSTVAAAANWMTLGLLVAYAALAIWRPARSLHDWLAGTYLVPR